MNVNGRVQKLEKALEKAADMQNPEKWRSPIRYIRVIHPETGAEVWRYTMPGWEDDDDPQPATLE